MMKRLVLVLMVFGLLGALPILAAENCDMKSDTEGSVSQCDLKSKSDQNKIERIEGEINNGSIKYTAEELKELEENAKEDNTKEDNTKEDNAILNELSKR